MDPQGRIIVADQGNHAIRRIDLQSGVAQVIAGTPGTAGPPPAYNSPSAVAVDAAGNVYIADSGNYIIREIPVGGGDVVIGSPSQPGVTDNPPRFGAAGGLAFYSGVLYVADTTYCTIKTVTPGTPASVKTVWGIQSQCAWADGIGSAARFSHPSGLVADGRGSLYVADEKNQVIRKIDLASQMVSTIAGQSAIIGYADGPSATALFDHPRALAVDPSGNNLFVAEYESSLIRVMNTNAPIMVSTHAGTPFQAAVALGPLPASLNHPGGIVMLQDGSLLVTSTWENSLLQIR